MHRRIVLSLLVAAVFWAAVPVSVSAGGQGRSPRAGRPDVIPQVTTPGLFDARRRPSPPVFLVRPLPASQDRLAAAPVESDLSPRVVCGLVVIPVSPDADPAMVKSPPSNPKVKYSIRAIVPPVCSGR